MPTMENEDEPSLDAPSPDHRHRANVAVVTDSAASLPRAAENDLGITVVPMDVVIGDETHPDGELAPEEILRLVAVNRAPITTSAPSPGAYLNALDSLVGHDVVVTTVARSVSASHEAATIAASYASDTRVAVVDTGSATGGQGLVVLAAARAAARGLPLDEVVEVSRRVAESVRLIAFLEQLDQLSRSGRVPGIAARAGRALGVRPLFEFAHGAARSLRPARSPANAVRRIADACRSQGPRGGTLHAAVIDAQSPQAAAELQSLVMEVGAALVGDARIAVDVYSAPCSSVMVAHTGPGLAGLAWWWETAEGSASDGRQERDPRPASSRRPAS